MAMLKRLAVSQKLFEQRCCINVENQTFITECSVKKANRWRISLSSAVTLSALRAHGAQCEHFD
jgi:hypothetical protein